MSAIITLESRLENAQRYVDDNIDFLSGGDYSYFFTGRTLPWDNEESPDVADSSESSIYDTLFQRVFMKQITLDDTTFAIKRFTWATGTVYTRADYNVDYTDYRNWYHSESPFYIINSEGNIYKCISNNYDNPSTVEPTGQSTNNIFLGDSYVWKFMFDLTSTIEDNFLTDTWIPVPTLSGNKSTAHVNVESAAVEGTIGYIHVDNAGDQYTSAPTVVIRGDGTSCTATAVMIGESIDYIQVTNIGSGYTWADAFIFGNGNGASCTCMLSPPGGHGSNAFFELGAFYIEFTTDIVSDEDGYIPTTGTYRNIGIVKNTVDTEGALITDEKFNTLSTINITDSSGTFLTSEKIIGEESYAEGILYYDPTGVDKVIDMYMIRGTFTDEEYIHGQQTGESAVYDEALSTINDVDIHSGDLLYTENIIFITRKAIQTEKFVFTIEF